MELSKPRFEKYLLVCENERDAGACCGSRGARIRELLKAAIHARQLASRIRVSRTGCLDVCAEGANVLLMPDNIWFKHVSEDDIAEILKQVTQKLSS